MSSEYTEEAAEFSRQDSNQELGNVLFPSESESEVSLQSMSSKTSSSSKKEEKMDYDSFSKLFEPENKIPIFRQDKNESSITDDYSKFVRSKSLKRKINL
jgi:hypothetical protein